ncbi:MAG: Rieske (2Fe-2S) region [Microgenomates group bacterium GW2011_GWA2_44_7]|nr:MAG: Rieske (2Fe-2S) region [Microgenomates group bacterium GW2011_GWA2_44_7]KKT77838.1 MAG: Rieske (2Fe-2S) region [Microgenomates group bacterium GW2011_GWB1_44_8]
MATWVSICKDNQVKEGEMKGFNVGGKSVAVARVKGEFLVFNNVCTHAECELSGGTLDGKVVTCWCHGSEFDIQTGRVLTPPAKKPLQTYQVKVEDGQVLGEF